MADAPFELPADRYDEMLAVYRCFHDLTRGARRHELKPPADIDARIAKIVGIPEQPFTTSIEAAFALKDAAFAGYDYVNVDLREYDDERGLTFNCDIRTEGGESNGTRATRPMALTLAVVTYLMTQVEMARDDAR